MNKKTPQKSRSKTSKKNTTSQLVDQAIDESLILADELTAKAKAEAVESLAEAKAEAEAEAVNLIASDMVEQVKGSMADLNKRPEIDVIVEQARNPLQHMDEDIHLENMSQDVQDLDKQLGEGIKASGLGYDLVVQILALNEGRVSQSGKTSLLQYVTRNKQRSEGLENEFFHKNASLRGMIKRAFDSVINDSLNALEESDRLRLNGVGTITTGKNALPRFDETVEVIETEAEALQREADEQHAKTQVDAKIELDHINWFYSLDDEKVEELTANRLQHIEDVNNKTAEKEALENIDTSEIVIPVGGLIAEVQHSTEATV